MSHDAQTPVPSDGSSGQGARFAEASAPSRPAPPDAAVPEAPEVRAIDVVDPATVRRAPRLGRFIATGVLTGLVLGAVIGLALFRDAANRGATTAVFVLDVTVVTTIVAAVWAVVVDRRSRRARPAPGSGER